MPLDFPGSPTSNQVFDRYKWNATDSVWSLNLPEYVPFYEFEYLVIGGGGSGGYSNGGSGGAGGYRSSVSGEMSGGGASAELPLYLSFGSYTVTVGAGGAARTTALPGANGNNSEFAGVLALGGGGGGGGSVPAKTGGSGGGASTDAIAGSGLARQGFAGENANAGAGGGAGEAGGTDGAKAGGDGISSSITGSAVTRGGGGAGQNGTAGDGGGGTSTLGLAATAGAVSTGGGGGGYTGTGAGSGAGGSGIVILKYPVAASLIVDPGLTSTTTTSGGFKITTFTAGTGTITVL